MGASPFFYLWPAASSSPTSLRPSPPWAAYPARPSPPLYFPVRAQRLLHGRRPPAASQAPPLSHGWAAALLAPSHGASTSLRALCPSSSPGRATTQSSGSSFLGRRPEIPAELAPFFFLPGRRFPLLLARQPWRAAPDSELLPCFAVGRPFHYLAPSSRSELHRRPTQQAARCSSTP
jgi:hypothetical protein